MTTLCNQTILHPTALFMSTTPVGNCTHAVVNHIQGGCLCDPSLPPHKTPHTHPPLPTCVHTTPHITASATGSERTDFLHEIDTMKKIAKGNNPHVVGLVGCVTIQEPLCLITEFVKHGDLLSYLQNIRKLVLILITIHYKFFINQNWSYNI